MLAGAGRGGRGDACTRGSPSVGDSDSASDTLPMQTMLAAHLAAAVDEPL